VTVPASMRYMTTEELAAWLRRRRQKRLTLQYKYAMDALRRKERGGRVDARIDWQERVIAFASKVVR
jgi:hypothetical protein